MTNPRDAARQIRRDLARLARPSPGFDASRYFRDAGGLQVYNVGSSRVRQLACAP